MTSVNVGIIGCGNISNVYCQAGKTFDILNIVACADLDIERAKAKAAEHGIAKGVSPAELLADPDIQLVINLTIPKAHYDVCKAALTAGKHVHVEKPLSLTREQGKELLDLAASKNLRIGGAPDTFLGAGLQTCRKLVDDGWIGEPLGATAFMLGRGPEPWHPDPEFFYKPGGGPMFDMGPYYLTALVSLLGPIARVTGATRATYPERVIGSGTKKGQIITVDVPTHIAGIMEFASGPIATITTSFDVWAANVPIIEIYGTEGSLSIPDPNNFGGPVKVRRMGNSEWNEVPLTHGYSENSRGIGPADLAYALQSGRPHRASGVLAYHVLETMIGFHEAADTRRHYEMQSAVERPAPLPMGLAHGLLDA